MSDPTEAMPTTRPPHDGVDPEAEAKPSWWQRRMPVWAVGAIALTCLLLGAAATGGEDAGDEEVAAVDAASSESLDAANDEVESLTADLEDLEDQLAERDDEVDSLQAALEEQDEPTTTTAPTTTAPPATTTPPTTQPAPPAGSVSQENARSSAADYLDFSSFSRSGLIAQLEYEGFSNADATYGVDSLNVDWNEQAAKSAADYLSFTSFSRSGLIEQLKFDGFTQSEAEYGVSTTGL